MKKNNFIENCLIVISTLIITVITSVAIWSVLKNPEIYTPDIFSQKYDKDANNHTDKIINAFYPFTNVETQTTLIFNERES